MIRKPHLFAVRGERGMVVGRNAPHQSATLSVNGALRVQVNTGKNALLGTGTCTSNLIGTVKVMSGVYNAGGGNASQVCPCLCNGSKWQTMISTPQCINACEGRVPQGSDKPVC
jgi:hypothetical protein